MKKIQTGVFLILFLSMSAHADTAQDTKLTQAIEDLAQKIDAGYAEGSGYEPNRDQALAQEISDAEAALSAGANSKIYDPAAITFEQQTDLSLFDTAILIAGNTFHPELVQDFLNHGASAITATQSGWSPMDFAVFSFQNKQTDSKTEILSGIKIIQELIASGANISQSANARESGNYSPASSFKDLAHELLVLKIMVDQNLVSEQDLDRATVGPVDLEEGLKSATQVTDKFLTDNGASLNRFPEAIPTLAADPDYPEVQTLTPPASYDHTRTTQLFVTEPKAENGHSVNTFRIALHTALKMNAGADLNKIDAWDEYLLYYTYSADLSNSLKLMLNIPEGPLKDRVVFSHSFGVDISQDSGDLVQSENDADSSDFQSALLARDTLEKGSPIIFQAAGNNFLTEGNYVASFGLIHSPRTVVVGAVGRYDAGQKFIISPYTSIGADICAPIPKLQGKFMEGSSCSTPLAASTYRQFSEWYGNRLSFEQILAAAMLTADSDISTFEDVTGANQATLNQTSFDSFRTLPASFVRNGGGLPHSTQCGAGVINETGWQKALDWMVANTSGTDTAFTQSLNLVKDSENSYSITIPKDMTLGRLTFFLPQDRDKHGNIWIKTPAQFRLKLPLTTTDVLSTWGFAFEDVKAGQKITIETDQPLILESSSITLRGQISGNSIQKLRDHLHSND